MAGTQCSFGHVEHCAQACQRGYAECGGHLVSDCAERPTWALIGADGWAYQHACDEHKEAVAAKMEKPVVIDPFPY